MGHGIDLDRVSDLKRREDARFMDKHPRSLALRERARTTMPLGVPLSWMSFLYDHPPLFVDAAEGAHFTDVDGHRYLDMSLGITVASTGHTSEPVVRAVTERMAKGIQFHLPTEDAAMVSEELARRWGLPKWQYQLSSTQANTDAIHLARLRTGRERIVVFEGKYQGHLAELLAVWDEGKTVPEYLGVTDHDIARTTVVAWNDPDGVAAALASGDVALVIAEPALTNSGIVLPSDGFHAELRRLTREQGTRLAIDETQTLPMFFGGLVREWGLEADLVILGKSLGGGAPVAALGMTDAISALIGRDYAAYEVSGEEVDEPAIGGTLFGNALSMAAARAALLEVWTEETHLRMQDLARALAEGMESVIRSRGRDWNVYRLGNRAGYRFAPTPPRNNQEAGEYDLPPVRHLQRVFMANRGAWDFGWWGGPAISAQTTSDDVDAYLGVFAEFIEQLFA
jgi:glutamate-1-semialdehyde aminotransferase